MDDKKFKATLRIPTREQYAYIEVEIEGTMQEIARAYLYGTMVYKQSADTWEKDKPPF